MVVSSDLPTLSRATFEIALWSSGLCPVESLVSPGVEIPIPLWAVSHCLTSLWGFFYFMPGMGFLFCDLLLSLCLSLSREQSSFVFIMPRYVAEDSSKIPSLASSSPGQTTCSLEVKPANLFTI